MPLPLPLLVALALPHVLPPEGTPPPGGSQEQTAEVEDPRFQELEQRYAQARDAYASDVRKLRRQGVPQDLWPPPPAAEWLPRFRELAADGSARADLWILQHLDALTPEAAGRRALAEASLGRLSREHADSTHVVVALDALPRLDRILGRERALELLADLGRRSEHPEVAARALFEQAMVLSEQMTIQDPATLERTFELLHVVVDGYAGTVGATFAADKLFYRERFELWRGVRDWLERVRELDAAGTPSSEWPPMPIHAAQQAIAPLARAGHRNAQRWHEVVWPAYEQAERRGVEQALLWYALDLSARFHPELAEAMETRFAVLRFLAETRADEPMMYELLQSMQDEVERFSPERYEPVLSTLAERTTDERIRHQALHALAQSLARSTDEAGLERAVALFRRVEEGAPTERLRRQAELARRDLERLLPGAPAPVFETLDSEGLPLSLADYRGKAVLLVFWGFWDPDTEALLPELARLHERFAGEHFAILGMNSDLRDRPTFRNEAREHGIHWRNSLQQRRRGPVMQNYDVPEFPLLVLIDAEGVIRGRGVPLTALAERVEGLIGEQPAEDQ